MAGQSYYPNYYYYDTGQTLNAGCQGQSSYEERSCWRKLYDYQSGYWYYQNLLTNATQWEKPEGWDSWPLNKDAIQSSKNSDDSGRSMFRQTSEEIESKNSEYLKRKARRQIEPDDAKKVHWRPEGANEYNIWYDKWIGDHWKGMKDEGKVRVNASPHHARAIKRQKALETKLYLFP